jgi:hypothetical protein
VAAAVRCGRRGREGRGMKRRWCCGPRGPEVVVGRRVGLGR